MRTPQPDVRVVPHSAVLRICDVRVASCACGVLVGSRGGVSASDSVSALYVPSQRITPSLLALSSFFELRDLTLLSLSPKELRTRVTLSVMPSYYGVYGREE